ncbi:hypothetical protein SAMN05518849_11837 [Sphingobium sp. AP50]|uniref:hypothetical protein n=1 Tax=Sphingobium sp. AP50 TaxID=1884369 RepID=UPI0008C87C6E|nr:hypothetical protein [Sphingobium sp. AP50]SEJ91736.1 hypothetical protein SAMN05518849_11837 [Sphingobium sp. AP50]
MTHPATNGSASDALAPLCARVALEPAPLPTGDPVAFPEGAGLWQSSYARLLLWPVTSLETSMFRKEAIIAEGVLDRLLEAESHKERRPTVDGYLVLALPQAPSEDDRELVTALELSPRICRKHCIWPAVIKDDANQNSGWHRIADVTVVGLPDGKTAAEGAFWPTLDEESTAFWKEINPVDQNPVPTEAGGAA